MIDLLLVLSNDTNLHKFCGTLSLMTLTATAWSGRTAWRCSVVEST